MPARCCTGFLHASRTNLAATLNSVWFARLLLLLFVVKMHWGMWDTWAWTLGDAPEHLSSGMVYFDNPSRGELSWSPLYRIYFASVYQFLNDPLAATVVHRLIVIFLTAFLFFEIVRRLVPQPIALLIALWWAATPLNLQPLYTVHQFANLTNLLALFGLVIGRTSRGRGISLAVLAMTALFIRTETAACLLFLCVVGFWYEMRRRKRGDGISLREYAISYVVPITAVVVVWAGLASLSAKGVKGTVKSVRTKSAFAFCQNYSFTYHLRNPDPDVNVWLATPEICLQDFGKEVISITDAMRENPEAFGRHVATNAKNLFPSLQLAFFDVRSTEMNPDVVPTRRSVFLATMGTVVISLVWLIGAWLLYRDREYFLRVAFRPKMFAWACIFGFFLQAIPVAIFYLARSSFYLSGVVSLFFFTGLCLWAIGRKLPVWLQKPILLYFVAVAILVIVPSPWTIQARPYDVPKAIYEAIGERRLIMQETGTYLVATTRHPRSVALYLDPSEKIIVEGLDRVEEMLSKDIPLGKQLYDERVTLFFVCGEEAESHPSFQRFASDPEEFGWKLTGRHITGDVSWSLYEPKEPYPIPE